MSDPLGISPRILRGMASGSPWGAATAGPMPSSFRPVPDAYPPRPGYVPQAQPVYVPQAQPVYVPQPQPMYVPQPQPQPVYVPQPQPVYVPQPVYAPPAPAAYVPAPAAYVPAPAPYAPAPYAPAPQVPTPAPAPVAPAPAAQSADARVLALVNVERARKGLRPLVLRMELSTVATQHSQDMARRGFFDHRNPDGKSPFARMREAGVQYQVAAENIAKGQSTPELVVRTWMNSAGHRANILNPSVRHMGLGVVDSRGGKLWTQVFTD